MTRSATTVAWREQGQATGLQHTDLPHSPGLREVAARGEKVGDDGGMEGAGQATGRKLGELLLFCNRVLVYSVQQIHFGHRLNHPSFFGSVMVFQFNQYILFSFCTHPQADTH